MTEALVTKVLNQGSLLLGTYFKSVEVLTFRKSISQSKKAVVCKLTVSEVEPQNDQGGQTNDRSADYHAVGLLYFLS